MKIVIAPTSAALLLLLSSVSLSQSNTTMYGNGSDRLGILNGWQDRGLEVTFSQIGTFSAPIGGLAVSSTLGFSVSMESPSVYISFELSNPSSIISVTPTTVDYLDSLVYDPFDGVVYSHSDQGLVHTFAPDGTQTTHGTLSGLGADSLLAEWGSHGDLAIAPDSKFMYQVGFDLTLQDHTSTNWHSLLLIHTDNLTQATRLGQIPTDYGVVWGLAFDEFGNLFGVTSDSNMIEIDKSNGSVLWSAPIVDSDGAPIEMWDLASNPHTIPEPSGLLLMGLSSALGLTRRQRKS